MKQKWSYADAVNLAMDALHAREITSAQFEGYVNALWLDMIEENERAENPA